MGSKVESPRIKAPLLEDKCQGSRSVIAGEKVVGIAFCAHGRILSAVKAAGLYYRLK